MYGKAVQIDEINKIVTENIQKYLTDEKIEILGDPCHISMRMKKLTLTLRNNLHFHSTWPCSCFEIKLSKKNKVTYYEIAVDEKMKNDYLENYTRRYRRIREIGYF